MLWLIFPLLLATKKEKTNTKTCDNFYIFFTEKPIYYCQIFADKAGAYLRVLDKACHALTLWHICS
jgi:hypothetical protein